MISFALLAAVLLSAQTGPPDAPPQAVPLAAASSELSVQILDGKGEVPRAVRAEDLAVVEDGQPRAVGELAPISRPWRIAIYVDRVLTGSRTLRAAAGSLAERAVELAALGTVEVIVAEPQPRLVLPPTRDVRAIDEALSKLWLTGEARDDLRVLRQRFRDGKGEEGEDPADRVGEALEAEARLVRRQQDALSEWLLAQEDGGPRALLLVSDGFDADPAKFYRAELPETSAPTSSTAGAASPVPEGALEKVALETARTAAALGWTALPLPIGDSTLPDLRRLRSRPTPQLPVGGTITLGRKKPEGGGEAQPALPSLLAPNQPLVWLAEATGGELILNAQKLSEALAHLRSRFWLRYAAPRPLDGHPHAIEVRSQRPDLTVRARRWDVAGVPEAIAVARARRLLDGEEDGAGFEVLARIEPGPPSSSGERQGTLDVRFDSPGAEGALRLTVAGPSGIAAVHHFLTAKDLAGPEAGVYRLSIPWPEEAEAVAVIVEPVAGGVWGGQVVTLGVAAAEQAQAPISVSRPGLRLVPPPGNALVGKVRLRVNGGGGGEEIARVEVRLGERQERPGQEQRPGQELQRTRARSISSRTQCREREGMSELLLAGCRASVRTRQVSGWEREGTLAGRSFKVSSGEAARRVGDLASTQALRRTALERCRFSRVSTEWSRAESCKRERRAERCRRRGCRR